MKRNIDTTRLVRFVGLRLALALLVAGVLLVVDRPSAERAEALFHFAEIHEAMFGIDGDPNVQFVEINMLTTNQQFVANTRLSAWNADGSFFGVLLLLPGDVTNNGTNVRWIMGTERFASLSGLALDFTFPPASLPPTGMICWGAPGVSVPDPSTWDPADPLNYVDCIPYGGYTAPNIRFGPATPLGLGDGHLSLTRISHTDNASNDFAYACATPQNNAGRIAQAGPDLDGDGYVDCAETAIGKDPAVFCAIMRADVNGDGAVNIQDISLVAAAFGQAIPPAPERYDQNNDSAINIQDISLIATRFASSVTLCP